MRKKSKRGYEQKSERLERLVKDDLSNGKHVQRKLRAKIIDLGECPEELLEELQQVKAR